jgi:hypothetical protein
MRRLGLFLSLATLSAVAAFLVTASFAAPGAPDARHDLPVAALATEQLPAGQRLLAANLLGEELGARAGITADSYERARRLATTSRGELYFLPGHTGACLLLGDGITCGDPGSPDGSLLALLRADPSGKSLVGGGVVGPNISRVTITHPASGTVSIPVANGVFLVGEEHGLRPTRDVLAFTAE